MSLGAGGGRFRWNFVKTERVLILHLVGEKLESEGGGDEDQAGKTGTEKASHWCSLGPTEIVCCAAWDTGNSAKEGVGANE